MGHSFSASSGKNAVTAAANAIVQARQTVSTALNGVVKGEVIQSASLNAFTSLFTQYELTAALNAVLINSTLHNGLLSYWKLDGNSTDVLGANNGTDTAITYSVGNGKIIQGASGNGTTSKISVGSANLNLLTVSIACWVRPVTDDYSFFATRCVANGGSSSTYEFRMNPGRSVGMLGPGGSGANTAGSVLTLGVWSHVVATRTSAGVTKIYVDAVERASATGPVPTSLPSQATLIGSRDDNNRFLNHPIDEVGIWNRILTLAEVEELYLSSAGNQYPFGNVAPTSALAKFYYKLDSSETDAVAGLHNGSLAGGAYATGKINNGLILTGGTQRMNIGGSPNLGTAWTVAMWIFPTADNTAGLMTHNNNTYGFFRTTDKKINYYDAASFFTSSGITPLSTWSHVAITHDGTTVKFYINGALDPNSYTRPAATFLPIQLGADQFGNGFVGTIDEAGAWTRALSATDITALYNAGAGIQYPF